MSVAFKICGLTSREAVDATVEAGAAMAGFMFFPRSPRHLELEVAAELAGALPASVASVAVTVNADDALIDAITGTVRPSFLQAHGQETPDRIKEIAARSGLPVIKVLPVSTAEDLTAADAYADVADRILFDAKPPKGATRPGGLGAAFDWTLLAGYRGRLPWILSGGLDAGNVAEALRVTGARAVDLSSGVERELGVKDPGLIHAFADALREGDHARRERA